MLLVNEAPLTTINCSVEGPPAAAWYPKPFMEVVEDVMVRVLEPTTSPLHATLFVVAPVDVNVNGDGP
ncbi:hypothetical protein SDC9_87870 [bioreactor metagenome]|uniref:Uncharacterized protein n=1 Tax=bioreactor metagenome TaxID=1076179 RepID=A0A644ZK05_9ZZZZ